MKTKSTHNKKSKKHAEQKNSTLTIHWERLMLPLLRRSASFGMEQLGNVYPTSCLALSRFFFQRHDFSVNDIIYQQVP